MSFSNQAESPPPADSEAIAVLQARIAQLEAQLAETQARESRFRLFSDAAMEGILLHRDGIVIDANETLATMFGYPLDALIGSDALQLATPESRPVVMEAIRTRSTQPYRAVGLRRDGSTFPAEIVGRDLVVNGQPVRLAVIRDMTAIDAATEQLARSERLYRMLAENSNDVIWQLDLNGRFTYVSPAVERLRGYTPEEVLAQPLDEVLTPESLALVASELARLGRGEFALDELPVRYELEQPCKDGSTVWTEASVNLIFDDDGVVQGIVGVSRNITHRREMERQLARERQLMRTVLDNLPDSVYLKDTSGRFMLNNAESLRRMNAASQQDTLGKRTEDFYPPELAARWNRLEQQALETLEPIVVEEHITTRDEQDRWVRGSIIPIEGDGGEQITGLLGINQDITVQKQAEQHRFDLALERERIAILERFIGNASHDLKTPLTAMKVSLAVLERTSDEAKRAQHLAILRTKIEALEHILDDLLSLSRMDRNIDLRTQRLDIGQLVRAFVASRQEHAMRKRQTLQVTRLEDGLQVDGDPEKLQRVLDVLLTNAFSYTPVGGEIAVAVFRRGNEVAVQVADSGIGMDEQEIGHIFTRFYRADPARQTSTGGMGVGLTIAQKMIQAHRGRIEVESEKGMGSTFTIWLPISR
ncbi:MAG: hypothetical protein Kow0077_26460 [Anaerolineae bacterium]